MAAPRPPARHYCTYFDSRYLLKGIALIRSLARVSPGFRLSVLCLDDAAQRALEALAIPGVVAMPLAQLESGIPGLSQARGDRSQVEYFFTCTSNYVRWLRDRTAPGEALTYLDADLWFFASPEMLFEELHGQSVAMIPHRFPASLRHLESHGVYNVGWLSFADDANARACLAWWSERCLEWCHDRVEPGKYADQKYLDQWPSRFEGVHAIEHVGANVAPWNVSGFPISREDGIVKAGGANLIFYHFAAFKRLLPWLFEPALGSYNARMTRELRDHVYAPYVAELRAIERELRRDLPWLGETWGSARRPGWLSMIRRLMRGELLVT